MRDKRVLGYRGGMISIDHHYNMPDEEARTRLESLGRYWTKKWGFAPEWKGDTGHLDGRVKGVKFKGTVTIQDGVVKARMKAGFLAEKLGAKAYVERKIRDYLNPANSLESLNARISR